MASYDLRCGGCGNQFEVFVPGFLKEEHKECPSCGSRDVEQLFTGFMCNTGSTVSSSGGGGGHSHGFG